MLYFFLKFFNFFQALFVGHPNIYYRANDEGYIICEFFSNHYNGVIKVSDLAKTLGFSEKQTERLVLKFTGRTFKQELVSRRMEMARYLEKNTNMTMTEIALYVGYNSYNGFWKAYKKRN